MSTIEASHRGAIGSSMVAAICGVSPWESPYSIYQRIVGGVKPPEETERMRWGTLLEPLVLKEIGRVTGGKLDRRRFTIRTSQYGFPLVDRPDAKLTIEGVTYPVEGKTQSGWVREDWVVREGELVDYPPWYYLQTQFHMLAMGSERCYVGVLVDGRDPVVGYTSRDEAVIQKMLRRASCFWHDHVIPRIPPSVDAHKATTAALREVYRSSREVEVVLDASDAEPWLLAYSIHAEAEAEHKAGKEDARNHLIAMMGEAQTALVGDQRITWKPSRTVDTDALAAERPDIAARFAKGIDISKLRAEEPDLAKRYTIDGSRSFKAPERKPK